MPQYRCYLLDFSGRRFMSVEELEAETDELAIAMARRLVAARRRKAAFELWELARQVHVEPLGGPSLAAP